MHHFPPIPPMLLPLTPFVHEADSLMETILSGQLNDTRQHESQIVAYYCLSHAVWLGQNVHTPDAECSEFICSLALWQERLRPHPTHVQQSVRDQNNVCELLGSIAMLCHEQHEDTTRICPTNVKGSPSEQCCISTGPATASMEVFENERHAPFVGWSAAHLLPCERGHFSNESGTVSSC